MCAGVARASLQNHIAAVKTRCASLASDCELRASATALRTRHDEIVIITEHDRVVNIRQKQRSRDRRGRNQVWGSHRGRSSYCVR